MAYQNPYQQQYQYPYTPQIQPPMDRLQQLQAQQYQMPQMQTPPQTNQGLLWVQGEAAARSYLVAPNTTVLLMDSDASRFYLKSADNAGMPSLRMFEYKEVSQNAPQAAQSVQENLDDKYVTRQEYDALQAKYAEIMDKLDSFRAAVDAGQPAKGAAAANAGRRSKGGNADE